MRSFIYLFPKRTRYGLGRESKYSVLCGTPVYNIKRPHKIFRLSFCAGVTNENVSKSTMLKASTSEYTPLDESLLDAHPKVRKITDISDQITVVTNEKRAREVLAVLMANKDKVWGCDTEVADINVKTEGPVGNGKVVCVSIYGGPHVDFGDGPGSALWIENIGGEAEGILQIFKAWFEDDEYMKVWHNYGFDRHVMGNEGISCKGFAGDTMHMARIWY